jgi:hypothetical protein
MGCIIADRIGVCDSQRELNWALFLLLLFITGIG